MARSFEEIRTSEEDSYQHHNRNYWILFALQWAMLLVGAVAGAINAFAQLEAAQDTPIAADPMSLFWTGIASAIVTLCAGPLTVSAANQKKFRDFHLGMIGKIDRDRYDSPIEADNAIQDYFDKKAEG